CLGFSHGPRPNKPAQDAGFWPRGRLTKGLSGNSACGALTGQLFWIRGFKDTLRHRFEFRKQYVAASARIMIRVNTALVRFTRSEIARLDTFNCSEFLGRLAKPLVVRDLTARAD